MRKGMQFTLLILPAVLLMSWGSALRAQEGQAATPQAKPDTKPAVNVPPEVQQKAKTYKGSPTPPKDLKREADGHWTPYTAPEKAPEGTEAYVIQKGDCLSVLAQQKLGTWLLWPQLWDQNTYIKDAHWIYPGDPLYITKPKVVSEEGPIAAPETPKPGEQAQVQIETEAPQPPVNEYDIYCTGFITKNFRVPHLTIVSSPNNHVGLSDGDVVYLNEGKAEGLESGMKFQVLFAGPSVYHPMTGEYIGRFIRRVGQVKVLAVQAHVSLAAITQSCDEIVVGLCLAPWKAIPIPWDINASAAVPLQVDPPSQKPMGRVIWSEDRLEATGQHNTIYVELGAKSQLLPGDKVWIFRYPAQQKNLVDSTTDLFRQQKLDFGPRDLFRLSEPPKQWDISEAEEKDERQGSVPAGSAAAAPQEKGGPEMASQTADTHAGRPWPDIEAPASEGVKYVRQYIGEGVVLTTESGTSCVKILSSGAEISLGDWVQVE